MEGAHYIVTYSKNESAPLNWVPLEYSTNMAQWSQENLTLDADVPLNGLQLVHATLAETGERRLFFRFAPSNP